MFPGFPPNPAMLNPSPLGLLVAKVTLGAAATSITMSGLSLQPVDQSYYLLRGRLLATVGGNPGANMLVNGTGGVSNYFAWRAQSSSFGAQGGSTTSMFLSSEGILASGILVFDAVIFFSSIIAWSIITQSLENSATSGNPKTRENNTLFPTSTGVITSIGITSGGVQTYDPGTTIALYQYYGALI